MTDILFVLPEFSSHSILLHLLPSLSKATSHYKARASYTFTNRHSASSSTSSSRSLQNLQMLFSKLSHSELKETPLAEWQTLSLLDSILDKSLGGGIPSGYLTEITGERYGTENM